MFKFYYNINTFYRKKQLILNGVRDRVKVRGKGRFRIRVRVRLRSVDEVRMCG